MTPVRLQGLVKRFGNHAAVDGVDLSISPGEFFTLLGPSGCGKTTLLRTIAGFHRQDAGHIFFGEECMDRVPAHRRNTGMVFQNYAIFPHLTVYQNIAYGLRMRKVSVAEARRRIEQTITMTRLNGLENRMPRELSGGQQQRVVLGRALAVQPAVLLMDEPLSNLDASLRVHLRSEIRALQRQICVTTIYVTHDQEEALTLSDRVAVMRDGRLEQVGTPMEIYLAPGSRFVAGFVGGGNFLRARRLPRAAVDGPVEFEVAPGCRLQVDARRVQSDATAVVLGFRSHDVRVVSSGDADVGNVLRGPLQEIVYSGAIVRYSVEVAPGVTVVAEQHAPDSRQIEARGAELRLMVHPARIRVFPEDGA